MRALGSPLTLRCAWMDRCRVGGAPEGWGWDGPQGQCVKRAGPVVASEGCHVQGWDSHDLEAWRAGRLADRAGRHPIDPDGLSRAAGEERRFYVAGRDWGAVVQTWRRVVAEDTGVEDVLGSFWTEADPGWTGQDGAGGTPGESFRAVNKSKVKRRLGKSRYRIRVNYDGTRWQRFDLEGRRGAEAAAAAAAAVPLDGGDDEAISSSGSGSMIGVVKGAAALFRSKGQRNVQLSYAGRTDAGVFGVGMVCMAVGRPGVSAQEFKDTIQRQCGEGHEDALRVTEVVESDNLSMHASFSAAWRRYVYLFPLRDKGDRGQRAVRLAGVLRDRVHAAAAARNARAGGVVHSTPGTTLGPGGLGVVPEARASCGDRGREFWCPPRVPAGRQASFRDRAYGAEDYLGEEDRVFVGWRGYGPNNFALEDFDPETVCEERDADPAKVDEVLRALEGRTLVMNALVRGEPEKDKVTQFFRCRAAEVSVPSHCAGGPPVRCIAVDVAATGFRRRMVRCLVAAAIRESVKPDGEYDPELMLKLSAAGDRKLVPVELPAEGLSFVGVGY